ncbi:sigma-70 family RNA polymerase sigma factor [Gimesia chilikensis]|uniref:RNA polymerase sigma factor n=1 Tax=Gimesia chilikensis TaxID=2605989 RepID=A0A517PLD9_9PLAN|nr:sigma-70 family RNA polymerase sigma factor [Gimesia chilikensis]QDT20193.1 RNA polymerase sigma factor [Gimesia chilikensis]
MEQKKQELQFTTLLTAHRRQLYAFIYSLLTDHTDAEDVYQRCSMILWDKFDQYDMECDFLPWAMGIAFYEVKNFLRVSSRDRHHFSEQLLNQLFERMQSSSAPNVQLSSLEKCLKSLRQKDLWLVQQVYWERRKCTSVAEEMGMKINALYDRVGRIRGQLRDCVQRRVSEVEHA